MFIDCDPYGYLDVVTPYIAAGIAAQQAAVTQPARDFGFTLLGTLRASRAHAWHVWHAHPGPPRAV